MDCRALAKDCDATKNERLEALLRAQLSLHQPHWEPAGSRNRPVVVTSTPAPPR